MQMIIPDLCLVSSPRDSQSTRWAKNMFVILLLDCSNAFLWRNPKCWRKTLSILCCNYTTFHHMWVGVSNIEFLEIQCQVGSGILLVCTFLKFKIRSLTYKLQQKKLEQKFQEVSTTWHISDLATITSVIESSWCMVIYASSKSLISSVCVSGKQR